MNLITKYFGYLKNKKIIRNIRNICMILLFLILIRKFRNIFVDEYRFLMYQIAVIECLSNECLSNEYLNDKDTTIL